MFARRASGLDCKVEEREGLRRRGLFEEEPGRDDLARMLVHNGAKPVEEGITGWQAEGVPGDPGAEDREQGPVDVPNVVLVLSDDPVRILVELSRIVSAA